MDNQTVLSRTAVQAHRPAQKDKQRLHQFGNISSQSYVWDTPCALEEDGPETYSSKTGTT